ncbi:hypothetical protein Y032_0009g718 [Ancylostoma ceylanicum]|uniref:Uncharacterized protein n=1 Tax=Ancylostoma ceylanicum TaxID=53326 RepID=A0A016VIH1_9BILA|nr:hypothetical protein Y032_0009g718 [Ancylostoma ceylanicum]
MEKTLLLKGQHGSGLPSLYKAIFASKLPLIFLFLKFAGGTSSIILIGAIKTFPTMKKFDIPIKSVKKEGFRQHYSLVLINGSTLAYRMTAPFTEGIVAETGFTKKKSCYNCLHF